MASETLYDDSHRPIGKIEENADGTISVFDEYGHPLGTVKADGTYDARGIKVSSSRLPGLLIKGH